MIRDLIAQKRDDQVLRPEQLREFVSGVTSGDVSDSQIAAMTMAIYLRGMDVAEQRELTLAMRDSGEVLNWRHLNGPALDKHSTGGVGDMVSLILGPLVAAAGGYVPMISGRGLGHTGGTLDKLESIPGFDTAPDVPVFRKWVERHGVSIIGQTASLVPADRRIYAVRDAVATVDCVPLIVSSILSKKLAEGLDGLVLDVKCGAGALIRDAREAAGLAAELVRVAHESGLPCCALMTDKDAPIAWSAGNALEVMEVIRFLRGDEQHPRLRALTVELAAEMLVLGRLQPTLTDSRITLDRLLDSGAAAECFATMVAGQGGPADLLQNPGKYLASAPVVARLESSKAGRVDSIDLRSVGLAVVGLGGGRRRASDRIDPAVGIARLCRPGEPLATGSLLAEVHASDADQAKVALRLLEQAIRISTEADAVPGSDEVLFRSASREVNLMSSRRTNPSDSSIDALIEAASTACGHAHAPYSGFRVGAAVLGPDGRVFSGCNVENASFGLTVCAERNALAAAIAAGADPGTLGPLVIFTPGQRAHSPCGACRQVMRELMASEAVVVSTCDGEERKTWTHDQHLPEAFTAGDL